MYYEEKVIAGLLMCRTTPNGQWLIVIRTGNLTQEVKHNRIVAKETS